MLEEIMLMFYISFLKCFISILNDILPDIKILEMTDKISTFAWCMYLFILVIF